MATTIARPTAARLAALTEAIAEAEADLNGLLRAPEPEYDDSAAEAAQLRLGDLLAAEDRLRRRFEYLARHGDGP